MYGMRRFYSDPCVYERGTGESKIILAVYVDDILIFTKDQSEREKLKKYLKRNFDMKDLEEVRNFLGTEIKHNKEKGEIIISQRAHTEKILEKYKMKECNCTATPTDPNVDLTACDEKDKVVDNELREKYQEAVGSLLLLAQVSRPEIAYAVSVVSRYCRDPRSIHWTAVKRIMRYLRGTLNYCLRYTKGENQSITGYSDADWANDKDDRQSITGNVFLSNGAAITWKSKKQGTTALSTVEAEYIALSSAGQEAMWLQTLSGEMNAERMNDCLQLYCDNSWAISLLKNECINQRTKHINVRCHFIRDLQKLEIVNVSHVAMDDMTADIFTKALNRPKFEKFVRMLGLTRNENEMNDK